MALGFLYFCSLIWVNPGLACEINADPLVQKDTLLAGQPFWSSPAVDIGACAKACMRLKICSSFNYVLNSTLCELSSDTAENRTGLVSNVTGCVYSDIMDWPATLDPECVSRPCNYDEVCMPQEGDANTSYSCLRFTLQPSTPVLTQGYVIFRDDFNSASLNMDEWEYEVSMFGGYNWELQVYTNDPVNVFIRNGYLYIKPTLTAHSFDEGYLTTGRMNVSELWGYCTNADNYGCVREGRYGMLPPVMSGKIKTKKTITYGRVDVRAKIPKGDWLWPAIWMLPRETTYGGWPASGEIDIMDARGNTMAKSGGGNHGVNEVTSSLQWGPDPGQNRWYWTNARKVNVDLWSSDFHIYSLDWNSDRIIFRIDDTPILTVPTPETSFWEYGNFSGQNVWSDSGRNAPFDHPYYLIINVAVGGTNGYFPDEWIYNTPKPWNNTSPTQNEDFWSKRNDWSPTWVNDDVALIVDYVQMTQY